MRRVVLLSLALLCLSWWSPTVRAEGNGVIEGVVVNGTSDGGSMAGLEVNLRVFQGQSEMDQLVTTTDDQGGFRFTGLSVDPETAYLLQVSYQDVVYSQGVLAFQEGEDELSATVQVYETTTEAVGIRVGRAHVFISVGETSLSVTELYVFENPMDRTYVGTQQVGGRRWTSKLMLPSGSSDLVVDDGTLDGRFLSIKDGIVDTEPQWPGTTSVMFSYELACARGECDLARKLEHPIANLNVLIPDVGVTVESGQLSFEGTREAQGETYLNYAGTDLAPGTDLDLRVHLPGVGSSPASSQRGSAQALPWIILVSVLAGLALAYPFWRRRIEATARKRK